jgi:hypothetical protein
MVSNVDEDFVEEDLVGDASHVVSLYLSETARS